MAKKNPLIRIPTQPVQLTLFALFAILGPFVGIYLGASLGHCFFGHIGAIIGFVAGAPLGFVIGRLPGHFMQEWMFRKLQKSSNEKLRAELELPFWNFYQTLALLNLQVRGEDVQSYLPRALALLESNDLVTRIFGRDALRLVFTPLAVQLDGFGYDPKASTEDCRAKAAQLREKLPER